MTSDELDALEVLLAKGTVRPWREAWTDPELSARMEQENNGDEILIAGPGELRFGRGGGAVIGTLWWEGDHIAGVESDCALIVGAVNALPLLIEEIRRLRAVASFVPTLIEYSHTANEECVVEEMGRRLSAALSR
jgi:hypothetical protein